jgi:secondary thiamine-phosphate synthase enzyme
MSRVVTSEITFMTSGEVDIRDLTMEVDAKIGGSGIQNGTVTIFVPGSTAAITTIEYEPGLLEDIPDALERLFPKNMEYGHEMRWHDGNGHSHVRAAFLGPSLTVPITGGRMSLGTWQQVVFVELDNKARDRRVILQIMGE